MKTNTKAKSTMLHTHGGAPAERTSNLAELNRVVSNCMLYESAFYEGGDSFAKRIADLVGKVAFEDAAEIARYTKFNLKLRQVPLFVARHLAKHNQGAKVGKLITELIVRPDEIAEFLSLYWIGKCI